MLQNTYSLPDLIDLALKVPEVGAVNFNILHTVLLSIVKELQIGDVRPWCHIENPLIAKAALTKAKLRRDPNEEDVTLAEYHGTLRDEGQTSSSEAENVISSSTDVKSTEESTDADKKLDTYARRRDSSIQTESVESPMETAEDEVPISSEKTSTQDDGTEEKDAVSSASIERTSTQDDGTEEKDAASSDSAEKTSTRDDGTEEKDAASSASSERTSTRDDGTEEKDAASSDSAEKTSTRDDGTEEKDAASSDSTEKTSTRDDGIEEKDAASSASSEKTSTRDDGTEEKDAASSDSTEKTSTRDDGIEEKDAASSASSEKTSTQDDGTEGKDAASSDSTERTSTRDDGSEEKDAASSASTEKAATRDDDGNKEKDAAPKRTETQDDGIEEKDAVSSSPERAVTDDGGKDKTEDSSEVTPDETAGPSAILPKPSRKSKRIASDAWKNTSLSSRVEATEQGLQELSIIVDMIVDKIRKAEQRKKQGGPQSEELEAIDERLLELEEAMAKLLADHELLMAIDERLKALLAEFEEIRALAALIKQMQRDIAKKANEEDILAALELKADLELVNKKVDQLEFETAIEELGEAIGLLGLKFIAKNDEWEERAAEIWRGIDSKMTRDVFEAARAKIESRLTALLFGLRKLKQVVEDLLYPEAAGVTRCILCRRPACISGLECLGINDSSPKRPLSDKSSSSEDDPNKLKKSLEDTAAKRRKLGEPPYSQSQDTVIHSPERERTESATMKLMPEAKNIKSSSSGKMTQVPKLPLIRGSGSPKGKRGRKITLMPRLKPPVQKDELKFTRQIKEKEEFHDGRLPADSKQQTSKQTASRSSSRSSATSVDLTPDPSNTMKAFPPARLEKGAKQRTVLEKKSTL